MSWESHSGASVCSVFLTCKLYILTPYLVIARSSTTNTSVRRYIMVLVIFVLYVLATITVGEIWAYTHHAFIHEGQNLYTVLAGFDGISPMGIQERLILGITSCISTFIADSSLVGEERLLPYKITDYYFNLHLLGLAVLDCMGPSMACCYHSGTLYYSRCR